MRTICTSFILLFFLFGQGLMAQNSKDNYISFKKTEDVQQYFSYRAGGGAILVSGHRGGREPGFPENSIGGIQNVLNRMPAFFEIDPRLTKDSVIVLMHDATLDRTTDATGKVSDYTWDELQSVRLKDCDGHVTSEKIPTLEDVILWSRGKTVINLDKKDVPLPLIVALIKKHKAEKHVMLTVHTGAQAKYYSDRLPGIMLSAFARNDTEYEDMAISGVPWKCMIAYVGPTINETNKHIVEKLHSHGVRCMVSCAPTHDTLKTADERRTAYKQEIEKRPDIIESDLPVEIWETLQK
jgi:glycerophosphoryl diester phosphodiesterase